MLMNSKGKMYRFFTRHATDHDEIKNKTTSVFFICQFIINLSFGVSR